MLVSGHGGTALIVCSTCRGAGRTGDVGRASGDGVGGGHKPVVGEMHRAGHEAFRGVVEHRGADDGRVLDIFRSRNARRDAMGAPGAISGSSLPVASRPPDVAGRLVSPGVAERSPTAASADPDRHAATPTVGTRAAVAAPTVAGVRDAAAALTVAGTRNADAGGTLAGTRDAAGTDLLEAIRAVAAAPRYAAIAVDAMACFWSCAAGVSVHLRAPGKIGYILGRFDADADAARALLDFAVAHDATSDGEVPFERWPESVLGHFIVRVPPSGMLIG